MGQLESLAILAALAVLAVPVATVVLFIAVSRLKDRVTHLERDLTSVRAELRKREEARPPAAPTPIATEDVADTTVAEETAEDTDADVAPAAASGPPITTGPWSEPPRHAPTSPAHRQPAARPVQRVSALSEWLKANWVYAISALSLALAGIFFVQYGVEKGLLPPTARVVAAILFGLVLIGAGEWIRRRYGDGEGATVYLPSTFSGAGLVSIFAGIVAARQLYGLIGAETALAGLMATAALAIVLGWFYGPFLAAVGLIGAAAAPFVVGGDSDAPYWLYGYYAVVAGAGLAVDTIRRWAWVSVLALVLGYGGGALVFAGASGAGWFALMLTAMVLLAVCVPARGLVPDHSGAMLSDALRLRGKEGWPVFPTKLAAGSVVATAVWLLWLPTGNGTESQIAFLCLAALAILLTVWSRTARALSDLTVIPAAGFLLRLGFEGVDRWPLARDFASQAITLREPETSAPMTATLLLAFALLVTLTAAWASQTAGRLKPFWAAGAALVAPLATLVLELFWAPSAVLGSYPWALHVMGLAAIMVALAFTFARSDGEDLHRAAYATLSALSLIALALFLITTKGALTLALAALAVAAAALDRRFRLPEMGLFIQAGVIVLTWRLVIDPGLVWAIESADLWEVVASYGGATVAMLAALWLLRGLPRLNAAVFLESAFAAYAALFVNVLITRWLTSGFDGDWVLSHWAITLNAMPWLILMLTQLYRLQLGGALRGLRWTIAVVAAAIGFGGVAAASTLANPLLALIGGGQDLVYGPPVIDTLMVAYALPGLLLLWSVTQLGHLARWIRGALAVAGAALVAFYAGLEVRRFWRGDDLSVPGVTQAELYSYTIALMLIGAGLLYQAIARRSQGLRRIAMAVIALTIAKVFLVDISGLTGLTRVFSFLALGLSLAGLAWLNRWAAGQQGERATPPE